MTSNPPWVSTVLVSAVKRKRDLFSVSRKFPTPVNMEVYRVQRNFVKYLSRKTYRSYISSLSATISSPNRPSLYQFIRPQRPSVSRAPIQCLIDPDGNSQSEAKSIADTLNKQFVSPGLPDDPNWVIPPLHPAPELRAPLLEVFTTTGVVRKQLKRLKSCKSPGKDGIPNEVLKVLVPSLSYPLCLLFIFLFYFLYESPLYSRICARSGGGARLLCRPQRSRRLLSYRAGVFPSAWKSAIVVAIFKKGQRSQAVNYRPISLLPTISKVCERIFYEALYHHVTPALSSA